MTVGECIKNARKSKGLTQEQLANAAEVATITIRQYESGKRVPKLETMGKIALALDTSVSEMINNDWSLLLGKTATAQLPVTAFEIAANMPDDFNYKLDVVDKIVLEHSRQLNDAGVEESIDFMAFLATKDRYKKAPAADE